MTADRGSKTVLVDIGGTLLTRTRPGPVARALAAVGATGPAQAQAREVLAQCLLTGYGREAAIDAAVGALSLTDARASELRAAVRQPEGDPVTRPGAAYLLRRSCASGWRVIAVTNTARWNCQIPDELRRGLDAVVSSAECGIRKNDPRFWLRLQEQHGVDPRLSVVIGDSPVPDSQIPASAGFCTLLVGSGGPSLSDIADWLARAAEPPDGVVGAAAGCADTWVGQRILPVPHLAPLVIPVTRCRVRISLPGGRVTGSTVVRRRAAPPVLLMPATAGDGLLWLAPVIDRRSIIVPADLGEALASERISMDGLPDRERRHLVSMVREARDPEVRQLRIADVVAYLRADRSRRGDAGG